MLRDELRELYDRVTGHCGDTPRPLLMPLFDETEESEVNDGDSTSMPCL